MLTKVCDELFYALLRSQGHNDDRKKFTWNAVCLLIANSKCLWNVYVSVEAEDDNLIPSMENRKLWANFMIFALFSKTYFFRAPFSKKKHWKSDDLSTKIHWKNYWTEKSSDRNIFLKVLKLKIPNFFVCTSHSTRVSFFSSISWYFLWIY